MFLNGQGIPDRDPRGQRVIDDSFLLCFNAHDEPIEFTVAAKGIRRRLAGRGVHRPRRGDAG